MAGITDDLLRDEIIELFQDRIEYQVLKRLDTAFAAKDPLLQWTTVTYDQLKVIMREEYGSRDTNVCEVLLQFGASRYKKTPDMPVAKFTHVFLKQYPECMQPESDDERIEFVDLIKRTVYYHCLQDEYIQKELCELPEADMNFKKYFDQAVKIESRRKSFQDIGASGAKLDPGNDITISKVESNKGQIQCYTCGERGHKSPDCPRSNKTQKPGNGGYRKSGNYDRNRNSQEEDPQPRNQSGEGRNQQSYNRKGYHAENDNHRGKSGYHDRSYKKNDGDQRSSSNNQKNRSCFQCGEYGHWRHQCTNKPSVKSLAVDSEY